MKRHFLTALAAALAALGTATGAQAHQIWFEQDALSITFRYGELEENLHERSPGGLDRFVDLRATRLTRHGEQPLALSKRESGFAVAERAGPGKSFIAIDRRYPMFDTKRDGKLLRTWWVPATRWVGDFGARPASLPLDIVPTGAKRGSAVEFQVVYKGEPLAGEKITLATPSGWIRKTTSDAEGKFAFALPWRGNYVIGLYYIDETAGERPTDRGLEPYALEGYNTALSFHLSTGLAPLTSVEPTLPASVLAESKKAAETARR